MEADNRETDKILTNLQSLSIYRNECNDYFWAITSLFLDKFSISCTNGNRIFLKLYNVLNQCA